MMSFSKKDDALMHISQIMTSIAEDFDFSKSEDLHSLQTIWNEICDEKFKNRTKILNKSDDGTLYISCENAMISNELYMKKKTFLNNIPKSFQIKNIIFSHKSWEN